GQIADVLDSPVDVVVQRLVEGRLELVQVLVARMEQATGRDEVVDGEGGQRDPCAERRGPAAAQPPPTAAHEEEERRREHDREPGRAGQAEQDAGKDLATVWNEPAEAGSGAAARDRGRRSVVACGLAGGPGLRRSVIAECSPAVGAQ